MSKRIVIFEVKPTKEGREKLFEDYSITICSPVREYGMDCREEAPADSNEFFGI